MIYGPTQEDYIDNPEAKEYVPLPFIEPVEVTDLLVHHEGMSDKTVGRPSDYSEEMITKSRTYLDECVDEIEEYHKTRGDKSDSYDRLVRVKLPTIEGLAVYLGVHRDTLYEWEKIHAPISDILGELRALQADRLINNALSGDYNPVIAKVLLTKHGYRDAIDTDHTTMGQPMRELPAKEAAELDTILANNQSNA